MARRWSLRFGWLALAAGAVGLVLATADVFGSARYKQSAGGITSTACGTGLTFSSGACTNNAITGVAGGQTITGGTASSEILTLRGTSHATPGKVAIADRIESPAGSASLPAFGLAGFSTGLWGNSTIVALAENGATAMYLSNGNNAGYIKPPIGLGQALEANGGDLVTVWNGSSASLLGVHATTGTTLGHRLRQAKGADVASGTNITLGSGNVFSITGTTTIDCIVSTNWAAGSEVLLLFDTSLTVTDGGSCTTPNESLVLAGAFSATAGDTLKLVLDAATGDWREIDRSAN